MGLKSLFALKPGRAEPPRGETVAAAESLSTAAVGLDAHMRRLFRRNRTREIAALAYGRVVEQARRPEFFTECGVPDTLDGRFELICLQAFLYLHRLKSEGDPGAALGQSFFDEMFADFDRSLREMGTGDLSVGREVKQMAQAFYGRIRAYERGLDRGDGELSEALTRNLFGTAAPVAAQIAAMAAYLRAGSTDLAGQSGTELLAGRIAFGSPPRVSET